MAAPTVVVIGGSFAGVGIVKKLDTTLKTKANLILIDEKDHWFLNIAALRTLTEPNFAQHIWVPYTDLMTNNPNSRVVHGRVVEIRAKEVTLDNDEKIAFDYLVIATGSSVPPPGKSLHKTKAGGVAEADTILQAVKAANSIAIVGGGAVGVELAGEIATDLPGKSVTIIHSGANLLTANSPNAKSIRAIDKQLASLNVKVILNSRVLNAEGSNSPIPNKLQGYSLSKCTLKTDKGDIVEADVTFLCTGISRPNSDVAKGLGDAVFDSNGYINTELTGQVKGFKHIFAAGDVSNLDSLKLAYTANAHAVLVGTNLASLIQKPDAVLKSHTPMKPGSLVIVAIGRKGGVLQTPIGVFGAWTVKNVKSRDLFIGSKWKDMNLKLDYKPPAN